MTERKLSTLGYLMAVSYTHLDVYKRQVISFLLLDGADDGAHGRSSRCTGAGNGSKEHVGHGIGAVSYTHLDVYKRQAMFHYNRIMVQLQQPLLRSDNDRIKHKPATLLFRYCSFYSIP